MTKISEELKKIIEDKFVPKTINVTEEVQVDKIKWLFLKTTETEIIYTNRETTSEERKTLFENYRSQIGDTIIKLCEHILNNKDCLSRIEGTKYYYKFNEDLGIEIDAGLFEDLITYPQYLCNNSVESVTLSGCLLTCVWHIEGDSARMKFKELLL